MENNTEAFDTTSILPIVCHRCHSLVALEDSRCPECGACLNCTV